MKTRLGALAIAALLAACSGQGTDPKSTGWQAQSLAPSASTDGLRSLSRDKARTLGSAPDKGELFTYGDKKAVKHQGAYTLHPVQLSEDHAIRGVATGLMTVPAPDGSEIRIRYERHEEHPDGNWSWIGKVIGGDAAQEAIFTFGEEAVFGSIPQAAGPALRLTTKGGIAYLMQADPSKLKRAHRAGGDIKTRARSAAEPYDSDTALVAMAKAKASTLAKADVSTKAFTSANTIDVVLGYSNGFVTANGSAGAAVTRLNFLLTVANQALLNSNVNARIRVVQALQVTYADNTDNGDALEQLTGHDGTTPLTPPASLLPLRTARDQYGADLVTLVRDFQPLNNGCGIAWLNGANGANITAAADAPFGYSVISDGEYDQDGNTYYCEDITLVHEMAHNMGSAHDVANAGGVPGRYPYSYGYKTAVANGNFFTVMAYGDDNQNLYRVFSSPLLTTCGGFACGVAATADNARSLRQTIPVIATFRATVVPIPGSSLNDINGDSRTDLIWRNTNGRISYWLMSGAAVTFAAPSIAQGTNTTLMASGDFSGDGRTDLVWQSTANVVMWTKNATGNEFAAATVSTTPAGWLIIGSGDLNGDGKTDLLWRNTSTGNFAYWLMSGAAATFKSPSVAISPSYKLVAIGDLNGDGRADLVWDNNISIWAWLRTATGFTQTKIGDHPAGWGILGSGDINGDGLGDLLWRQTASGNFSYWLMNGAAATSKSTALAIPTSYKLAAVGDLNNDGKADLVWDNQLSVWAWLGTGTTTFTQQRIADHPAGWTLQDPLGQ